MFLSICSALLFCAVLAPAAAAKDIPPLVTADVRLRFSETQVINEPVHVVVMPDNGPAPEPRAELWMKVWVDGLIWPNANLFVVFSSSVTPAACWCASQNQATWILGDGRRVFHTTADAAGEGVFQISAGGCFEQPEAVYLRAGAPGPPDPMEAIPFRLYNVVSSMDNGGPGGVLCDRAVNIVDFVRYGSTHVQGPYATCSDYNGDGNVNTADFELYGQHHLRFAHCP